MSIMSRAEVRVTLMRKPDTKVLSAIHTASFHKGWSSDYIAKSLKVEGTLAFVAQDDAAFALLRLAGDTARIVTLAVRPDLRGQGIGAAMLEVLLQESGRRKAREVSLKVNERHISAIHLYERAGFARVGEEKNAYSNPHGMRSAGILMRLKL